MTDSGSGKEPVRGGLREVAADATGFGAGELRMTRDLFLHPRRVLTLQGTADSPYPRPLRYYLALNGLYMVLIAVLGGFEGVLDPIIGSSLKWAETLSAKSPDAFSADLDQWYSLVVVPVLALAFYPPLRMLFARWSGARPDGQAFTFLSGWTLLAAPLGLMGLVAPGLSWLTMAAWIPILLVMFWRMGREVWWRTPWQYLRRVLVAGVVLMLTQFLAGLIVMLIALAGAIYGP